jgi:hypothetical protein
MDWVVLNTCQPGAHNDVLSTVLVEGYVATRVIEHCPGGGVRGHTGDRAFVLVEGYVATRVIEHCPSGGVRGHTGDRALS